MATFGYAGRLRGSPHRLVNRKKIIGVFLAIVGLLVVVGLLARDPAPDAESEASAIKLVEIAVIEKGKAVNKSELSAALRAGEETVLSSEVGGRLLELNCAEGDQVRRGQVLARIDAAEYSVQLSQTEAGLDKAQVGYDQAKQDFARMEQLYAAGAISAIDFENARNRLSVAEADLQQARDGFAALQDKARLKAPFDGTIIARMATEGQLVSPGVPIYSFGRMETLKAVLPVPDNQIGSWKTGDEVELSLYRQTRKGKVVRIHPAVNQGTGTIGVEVVIANPDRDWFPGQVVSASHITEAREGIFVPVSAVINRGEEKPYAFREVGGKAVKTTVAIGGLFGDRLEIISGLKPGDHVVVKGADQLFEGDAIQQPAGGKGL